ncbi:MAG: FtsX-like permease family protein [Bacilli bacterium]
MNILNKLTVKHLKMNKKRTIVTIIGIVLSTSLMVGIGLLLSSTREMMIEDAISNFGSQHIEIKDLKKEQISMIQNNANIKEIKIKEYYGYAKINEKINDAYFKIYGANEKFFNSLKLEKGRFPKTENEIVIPEHLLSKYNLPYEIGETLNLKVGDRLKDNQIVNQNSIVENEYIKEKFSKSYKIVGIIEKDISEGTDVGYYSFTLPSKNLENKVDILVQLRYPKKTFEVGKMISKSLKIKYESQEYYERIIYNDNLLGIYGVTKYNNIVNGMTGMLAILLSLVSIACIVVIYNSFAISVMERKKQFGLFSSIGATRNQLKKTVFFEAIIVAVIGIPLGIMAAYLGIGTVLIILNNLIKGIINNLSFKLSTYPLFIFVPILFMIITIFISAFLPAHRASKISPIEAIRLNDDIKIKAKKVRTPKFILKLFGIEGELALKNIKRNKKKYRITVVSLFISIVMFISFSGYLAYTIDGGESLTNVADIDLIINYDKESPVLNKIESMKEIDESLRLSVDRIYTKGDFKEIHTPKFQKFLDDNKIRDLENSSSSLFILDDKYFDEYLDKIGEKTNKPVLLNKYKGVIYKKNSRKSYDLEKYRKNKKINLEISKDIYDENTDTNLRKTITNIKDYHISSKPFLGSSSYEGNFSPSFILSNSIYKSIIKEETNTKILLLKTSNYKKVDEVIKEYIEKGEIKQYNYINIKEQSENANKIMTIIKILVYGFISLVTLIGVTSVFNTINTSIALRRKEFAVLRSIGLTPKGFNKILWFESLFFGLKAILYALPFSFGVILLMHLSMMNIIQMESILIPWKSIIIAIVGVFIIVFLSTVYATKKIKHENILNAIREENI